MADFLSSLFGGATGPAGAAGSIPGTGDPASAGGMGGFLSSLFGNETDKQKGVQMLLAQGGAAFAPPGSPLEKIAQITLGAKLAGEAGKKLKDQEKQAQTLLELILRGPDNGTGSGPAGVINYQGIMERLFGAPTVPAPSATPTTPTPTTPPANISSPTAPAPSTVRNFL